MLEMVGLTIEEKNHGNSPENASQEDVIHLEQKNRRDNC